MKPEGVWVKVAEGIEELRAPDAPPPIEIDRIAAPIELALAVAQQLARTKEN